MYLPKQVGYSDKFEATDETEIPIFLDENPEWSILGIVHTHPGFNAFLSSVDLHMLCAYTRENQAVVSIFLAPEQNVYPAFALTRTGMEVLSKCNNQEGFHSHNTRGLYGFARHLQYNDKIKFDVIDNRN